jgi:hypothetical protein
MHDSLSPEEIAAALDGMLARFQRLGLDSAAAVTAVAVDNRLTRAEVEAAVSAHRGGPAA